MIRQLARMELLRLLRSPLAWVLLAIVQFLLSWQLLEALESYTGLAPAERRFGLTHFLSLQLFGFAAVLSLFITPILTMRQFSEAFRSGSYGLLSSAPLSLTEILLGKYLGVLLFQLLLIGLALLTSLALTFGSALDLGLLAASGLGLALLSAGFNAVGLYFSTLSSIPALAVAGSYGTLLLLTILGQDSFGRVGSLLHWAAWPGHYLNLQLGLVRSADLAYFGLLSFLFLGLALHQLERRRSA
jgi:ABC-2 type transport system permease protein